MQKIKLISDTFEVINHVTQGNFVTIRNFDLIPDESSIENDILSEIGSSLWGKNMNYKIKSLKDAQILEAIKNLRNK